MHVRTLYKLLPLAIILLAQANPCVADITSDAEIILNWAEKTYPDLLPSKETTKKAEPYLYRNYISTDLYVGVNKQDSNVYYIGGAALSRGGAPILFDSVANVLKQAAPATTSNAACDATTLPAGVTVTQSGNVIKIATNGCIPEPKNTNNNFCTSNATGNVSVKATLTFETITNGVSETGKFVGCTSNATGANISARVESDLCYIKGAPPVTTQTKGTQVYERVDDCFKTDAQVVNDLLTNEAYFNSGSGFVKVPTVSTKQ